MEPALLDAAPIPTVVLRAQRVVHANRAALALFRLTAEQVVGRPYTDFLPPEEVARVAGRQERRLRGSAVPAVYETALVCQGERRTVEVHAAVSGDAIVVQLIDVTGVSGHRARLAELARLGALVQREQRDEDVWRAAHRALRPLGLESVLLRPEGDGLQVVEAHLEEGRAETFAQAYGASLIGSRCPWTPSLRQAWEDGAAFVDDWPAEARRLVPGELPPAVAAEAASVCAAAVRVDLGGRPAALLVTVGGWLHPEDLPAFRLFGAQISAALDAAASIQTLSARNAELDALNRVAEAAGEAPDLDALLARAAREVADAAGCGAVAFFLLDAGRREAALLHLHGGGEEDRRRLARVAVGGTLLGPAGLEGVARVRQAHELDEPLRALLAPLGLATVAAVPIRFRSSVLGVLVAGFAERREPSACRTELLQAMSAHFAAAIETQRLLGDLRGRVSELTLLNDIAVATAALDPVLLLENALRRISSTFGAETAAAYLLDGGELLQTAWLGVAPETAERASRLPVGVGPAGQAVEQRKTVHFPQLAARDDAQAWMVNREGLRTAVGVPLLVKDRVLGAFLLGRRRPEPFSEPQLALLSAVGVQLGVAVENARLFADTRRRVGDLEAVNSLALRVFGTAPGDAQGLLAATSREIARALSARSAVVLQLDPSGTHLTGVAGWGTPLPPSDLAIPLARSELASRALRTQEPVWGLHVFDRAVAGEVTPPPLSLLLVPLTSRRATRGLVAIGDAPQRRFSDAEVALAYALASEAAMGMENAELYAEAQRRVQELSVVSEENARLFGETRRRAEELGLLLEVGRSLVATLELDQVLEAGVRNLARIVGAPDAYLLLADALGEQMVIRAAAGRHTELVGRAVPLTGEPSVARWVYQHAAPVVVEDALRDARVDPGLRADTEARAYLGVPLVVRERAIGAAIIAEAGGARRFSPAEVERASAIANQLAVAVENARLYEDLRRSYADLARAQDQLVHRERLAALGELAAVVAHEVRNPLGVIFNSLGSLRRLVQPSGDARMLFDIVGEEADRLNRIVGDLLDFAKPAQPTLRPEPIDRVLDEAVAAALADGGGRVTVTRDVPGDLPLVPMDARLMRQAILNVAVNAAQAMPEGGTLAVRARVEDGQAVVELADTGPGIPEEVRHRIFEPFFTTKATGTGLGLAVVKRIVDDHHGRIEVLTPAGGGTVIALALPLEGAEGEGAVEMRRRMGRGWSP